MDQGPRPEEGHSLTKAHLPYLEDFQGSQGWGAGQRQGQGKGRKKANTVLHVNTKYYFQGGQRCSEMTKHLGNHFILLLGV